MGAGGSAGRAQGRDMGHDSAAHASAVHKPAAIMTASQNAASGFVRCALDQS